MTQKKNQPQKYSHLTYEDRYSIQTELDKLENRSSVRELANRLHKSTSSITRELERHAETRPATKNDCKHRTSCKRRNLCVSGHKNCSIVYCSKCSKQACKAYCDRYEKEICPKLQKAPHLCNGCRYINVGCSYEQRIYSAKKAQNFYRDLLVNRRNGFDLTGAELTAINDLASPLLKNGLSVYHVSQTLGNRLPCSETTLRRLIAACELDAKNIDLRQTVSRKVRTKPRHMHNELPTISKLGHTYKDYLAVRDDYGNSIVQMDCVEGIKTDKAVLLTLHFPLFHMQLALIMNEHTSGCVVETLDKVENALGKELFAMNFPLILTDNGHEFADIEGMERSVFGGMRTRVYFCEPNHSNQKGACENNHKFIRYVIPKSTSLEPYNQSQITLMMNHINSYKRKELYGNCPYDLAKSGFPEDFFTLLGLEQIPADELNLTPGLLK